MSKTLVAKKNCKRLEKKLSNASERDENRNSTVHLFAFVYSKKRIIQSLLADDTHKRKKEKYENEIHIISKSCSLLLVCAACVPIQIKTGVR